MELKVIDSLENIAPQAWNALSEDNPFLRHEFLYALETSHCLGQSHGWYPRYFLLMQASELVAAIPAYIKTNSYGEFVFDYAWAAAYERVDMQYYPKLVIGIPYSPVTGQRILVKDPTFLATAINFFHQATTAFAKEYNLSSVHWLFPTQTEHDLLVKNPELFSRAGFQYHWKNQNYTDFEHYISHFSSKKRKNTKRERRKVQEQGISLEIKHGYEIQEDLWELLHNFYTITFDKKWGEASLSLNFFKTIGKTLPNNILAILAVHDGKYVAASIFFRSQKTLYGRYWGCFQDYDSLHFEACYYMGIEYAIAHNLQTFEPGAGGEHKISRGFLPTPTYSAHWIKDEHFKKSIQHYCIQEADLVKKEAEKLSFLSPFKEEN